MDQRQQQQGSSGTEDGRGSIRPQRLIRSRRVMLKPRRSRTSNGGQSNSSRNRSSRPSYKTGRYSRKSALKKKDSKKQERRRRTVDSDGSSRKSVVIDSQYKNPTRRSSRTKAVHFDPRNRTPRGSVGQFRERRNSTPGLVRDRNPDPMYGDIEIVPTPDRTGYWVKVPRVVVEKSLIWSLIQKRQRMLEGNKSEGKALEPLPPLDFDASFDDIYGGAKDKSFNASKKSADLNISRDIDDIYCANDKSVSFNTSADLNTSPVFRNAPPVLKVGRINTNDKPDFEVYVDSDIEDDNVSQLCGPSKKCAPAFDQRRPAGVNMGLKGISEAWQEQHPHWKSGKYHVDYENQYYNIFPNENEGHPRQPPPPRDPTRQFGRPSTRSDQAMNRMRGNRGSTPRPEYGERPPGSLQNVQSRTFSVHNLPQVPLEQLFRQPDYSRMNLLGPARLRFN